MSSLEAQNQFGALIDSSQRQPVTITRRGRPVAVVQSCEDDTADRRSIPFWVAKLIGTNYPLRGAEAAASMRAHLAQMGEQAAKEGLTQDDVTRLLDDE